MSKQSPSDAKCHSLNAKLCHLVRTRPCIYDRTSTNFSRRECVDRAWADIARNLGDSVSSCKERWRNIRTAYARSVNIYKSPCGPNRHKNYYLYDELQFLTKHITPGLPSLRKRTLTSSKLEDQLENSRHVSIDESNDNCTFQFLIDSSSSPPPQGKQEEEERQEEELRQEEEQQQRQQEEEQQRQEEEEREHERRQEEEERMSTSQPENNDVTLGATQAKKRKRISSEDDLNSSLNLVEPQPQKVIKDPDMEFLNNILPEMKVMNARQKIMFKMKMFQALEEVFTDPKDFPQRVEPIMISISSPTTTACAGRSVTKSSAKTGVVTPVPSSHQKRKLPIEEQSSPNVPLVVVKQEIIQED